MTTEEKTSGSRLEKLNNEPVFTRKEKVKLPILYPNSYSEFEIQAYLYSKLLRMGFDVRGEVSAVNTMSKGSRFDLVIFKKGKATRIIEVKKTREERIHTQRMKYNRYGVGVHFVMGMEDAEKYIKDIRDYRKYLKKQKILNRPKNKRSTWRDSGMKKT